jgi:uncharacterized protein YnzC (UPF0291/DUF896 family)
MKTGAGHYYKVVLLGLVCLIGESMFHTLNAQTLPIKNDIFWYTKDGRPINSQGGGIFKFAAPATGEKKYYWYGVHYKEADAYRNDPSVTLGSSTFESVTCYSSTDLVNWKFEADVLTTDELKKQEGYRKTWVGTIRCCLYQRTKQLCNVRSVREPGADNCFRFTNRAIYMASAD